MRNTRKLKKGSIRDTKAPTSNLYMVLKEFDNNQVEILYINGKMSGIKQIWESHHCNQDIVIM